MNEEKELREQELREEAELRADRGEVIKQASESALLKRKWRKALALELVNAWHQNSYMWKVVVRGWNAVGQEPTTAEEKFTVPGEMMGVRYIHGNDKAQTFIAKHFRALNEALWAGRKTDYCILLAEKSLGMRKGTGASRSIPSRQGDKRHDWATVK